MVIAREVKSTSSVIIMNNASNVIHSSGAGQLYYGHGCACFSSLQYIDLYWSS